MHHCRRHFTLGVRDLVIVKADNTQGEGDSVPIYDLNGTAELVAFNVSVEMLIASTGGSEDKDVGSTRYAIRRCASI
jgi:hypothetical protein